MQDRDYIITTHSIQTNCAAPSTLTGPPASGVSIEGPTCVTRRKITTQYGGFQEKA